MRWIMLNYIAYFAMREDIWDVNDMSKSKGCQSAAAAAASKQKWRAFLKQYSQLRILEISHYFHP